jgi:hypothetical protein
MLVPAAAHLERFTKAVPIATLRTETLGTRGCRAQITGIGLADVFDAARLQATDIVAGCK